MARQFPRSRPGDKITAAHENDVLREVERLGRLTVGPGLELRDNSGGRQIRLDRKRKIPVILSGSASPYSWVEVIRSGGAWATLAGGQSGTSNAIEINGVTGLAGKFARIEECGRDAVGAVEYCFQQVKRGAPTGVACLPCTIPTKDLFGTRTYNRSVGSGGGTGTLSFTLTYTTTNPAPGFLPTGRSAYWFSGCVANPTDDSGYPSTTHFQFFFGCFASGPGAQFSAEAYGSLANCTARTSRLILDTYPDAFGHRLVGIGDCTVYDVKVCNNTGANNCTSPFPPYYVVSE